jgi:hypothetical protein
MMKTEQLTKAEQQQLGELTRETACAAERILPVAIEEYERYRSDGSFPVRVAEEVHWAFMRGMAFGIQIGTASPLTHPTTTDKEIQWAPRSEWDHATYSLNVRLYQMAGQIQVAEGLAAECRQKWGKEPDIRPDPEDEVYFRNAGLRRPRKPTKRGAVLCVVPR